MRSCLSFQSWPPDPSGSEWGEQERAAGVALVETRRHTEGSDVFPLVHPSDFVPWKLSEKGLENRLDFQKAASFRAK